MTEQARSHAAAPQRRHEGPAQPVTFTRGRTKTLNLACALAAATLTLAACGNAGSPAAVNPEPPARVTSIDGQQIRVPATGEPTAVFFFSVGCGACVGGVQSLGQAASAAAKARAKANVLAVDMDPGESKKTIEGFMAETNAEHVPFAIDTGAALSRRFKVAELSTLIVVDSKGHVTFRATSPNAKKIAAELVKAGA